MEGYKKFLVFFFGGGGGGGGGGGVAVIQIIELGFGKLQGNT